MLIFMLSTFVSLPGRSALSRFRSLLLLAFCAIGLDLQAADDVPRVGSSAKTAQEIMESARDSVVVIKQSGRDGTREGIGTGFVISEDGLIATSLHVIGEARPLTVSFADGKTRAVREIHAWDRKVDLAVIRVEAADLRPLRLGDSDNLKQGASVVAIGNPQGLTHSVVQGIVSAMRDFEFGPMIQLAIPIEPGRRALRSWRVRSLPSPPARMPRARAG